MVRDETKGAPSASWDISNKLLVSAFNDRLKCQHLPVDKETLVNVCGGFHYLHPPTIPKGSHGKIK